MKTDIATVRPDLDGASGFTCHLGMAWEPLGRVTAGDDGRLVFPKVAKAPALYRLCVRQGGRDAIYIGESDNLLRRFGNYRNPGPTQQTSKRINAKLRDALKAGAEIAVAVVLSGAWIDWGTGPQDADLSSKVIRCLFENAAISSSGAEDVEILNRATG